MAAREKEMAPARFKHAVSGGYGVSFLGCNLTIQSLGLRVAAAAPPGQATLNYMGVFASCEEQRGSLGYTDWRTQAESMGGETKWRGAV